MVVGSGVPVDEDVPVRASSPCYRPLKWGTTIILFTVLASNFVLDLDYLDVYASSNERAVVTKTDVSLYRQEAAPLPLRVSNRTEKLPKIAWLMSFPNSGTTYTLKFIQNTTLTTTATNYGAHEQDNADTVSVFPHIPQGPFFRHPDHDLPETYILTKTHCGGTCMGCRPHVYVLNENEFEQACALGNRRDNGTRTAVSYPPELAKAAVHLIRNPFDNLVARLHYEQKKWVKSSKEQHAHMLVNFTNDKDGFQRWCRHVDEVDLTFRYNEEWPERLTKALVEIPCYAEFGRFIQWHNNAIAVTDHLQIPTMNLFYENYTSNFNETSQELLNFLDLPRRGPAPLFLAQKHYPDFYEPKQIKAVRSLARALATPECWALVGHYFESNDGGKGNAMPTAS